MAKTANNNSNANAINNVDWVKDSAGRQTPRKAIALFVASHQGCSSIDLYPAKGDTRTRAKFVMNDGTQVWCSEESAKQIADNYDPAKKAFKKGAIAGLEVGEYYVTDQTTGERIHPVDPETGEEDTDKFVTDFMVLKSSAVRGSIAGLFE